MTTRPTIDVSHLPGTAFDSQAPVWWGNLLLMIIESMTLALLISSYFYVAQNFPEWPPPNVEHIPPVYRPLPDLTAGSWSVGLLVFATIPMIWADRAAREGNAVAVQLGLALATAACIGAIALRFYEFPALKVRWDDNAYASIIWAMLVLHLLYLILEVAECAINIFWTATQGLDEKHAVDVTLSTGYWYWMAGTGLIIYGVIYWAPRVMS